MPLTQMVTLMNWGSFYLVCGRQPRLKQNLSSKVTPAQLLVTKSQSFITLRIDSVCYGHVIGIPTTEQ